MDLDWDYKLKDGQRSCPVVYVKDYDLPDDVIYPTDEELLQILPKGYHLQTWARSKGADGKTKLEHDIHFIAVKSSTPLHVDPKYPRYSHHLKVRVDPDIVCRGLDKKEQPLYRGLFYILDAHSPHQVLCKERPKGATSWNVSVSVDSQRVLHPSKIVPQMIEWAKVKSLLAHGDGR